MVHRDTGRSESSKAVDHELFLGGKKGSRSWADTPITSCLIVCNSLYVDLHHDCGVKGCHCIWSFPGGGAAAAAGGIIPSVFRLSLRGESSKFRVGSDWRSVLLDISPVGRWAERLQRWSCSTLPSWPAAWPWWNRKQALVSALFYWAL